MIAMPRSCSVAAVLGLGSVLAAVSANALDVGVARCGITPDVMGHKVPLAGYGARKGQPSTGVHDSLHAKVLFFHDGKTSMAVVTCDLRSVTPQLKQQTLQKATDLGLTVDTLFLCASHTHDGPSIFPEKFWQLQFGECDPAVIDAMSSSIAGGLHAAARNLSPARVGFGSERLDGFTRNRRWRYDNGARTTAGETAAARALLSRVAEPADLCCTQKLKHNGKNLVYHRQFQGTGTQPYGSSTGKRRSGCRDSQKS